MIDHTIDKAVILAAGMGTRMRRQREVVAVSDSQRSVAETGVKALIPFDRPFVDYVLGRLAEAGYRRICLVIGPGHKVLREHCLQLRCDRVSIEFAVQPRPLGTANAVAAAETFAEQDQFLVVNSDNLYPLSALSELRRANCPATAGFDLRTVFDPVQRSDERLAAMAVMRIDRRGHLRKIVEKPNQVRLEESGEPIYTSMNCWRFGPKIFDACRSVGLSSRGEYELPSAVQYAIDRLDQTFRVIRSQESVLDLSHRDDIAKVAGIVHDQAIRL